MKQLALAPLGLAILFVMCFVTIGGPILFAASLLGLSQEAGMFGAAIGAIALMVRFWDRP